MKSPARTAVRSTWLAPDQTSVVTLARGEPAAWAEVRHDPAAVLLVCRYLHSPKLDAWTDHGPPPFDRPRLLAFVRDHWGQPSLIQPEMLPACRATARAAESLAPDAGVPAAAAWACGLLARLSETMKSSSAPIPSFRRHLRSWHLPDWLSAVIGYADAPAELVTALGAPPNLVRVVQTALATPFNTDDFRPPPADDLIRDYLDLAIQSARPDAEAELDRLTRAVAQWRAAEADRQRHDRLAALAEFAAGAGHEINTPLAVIAGRAQYLLARETDADRERSLQTIVQQAHRVSDILSELMQFARPSAPRTGVVAVGAVVAAVAEEMRLFAEDRRVRLTVAEIADGVTVTADAKQFRAALAALVRNALEAAANDGWVSVGVEVADGRVRVAVEDSGGGPSAEQRPHLFDPFYSGREAGRGRGLGLSTAWRLARLNGGDVTFARPDGGPTRFILELPQSSAGGQLRVA